MSGNAPVNATTPQGHSEASPEGEARGSGERPRSQTRLPLWVAFGGVLVALGHLPVLISFFMNLWGKPHYQFYPLAIFGALFLAWIRTREMRDPFAKGSPGVALGFFIVALGLLGVNVVFWSPWLGAVAMMCSLSGMIFWLGGWRLARALIPAGLVLLTMIPPPLQYDTKLTLGLQRLAVASSSTFMDLLNIPHVKLGNTLEVPHTRLLVDEACSGINSVLSVSAFVLFYGLWRRFNVVQIFLAGIAGLGFVLMGNLIRIVSGAYLKYHNGIDILAGWPHAFAGLILFAFYLGLVVSMYKLLESFGWLWAGWRRHKQRYFPGEEEEEERRARSEREALENEALKKAGPRRFSPIAIYAVGLLFAGVGMAHGAKLWHERAEFMQMASMELLPASLRDGGKFIMPDRIDSWQRVEAPTQKKERIELVAQFSHYWCFRNASMTAYAALDFPYHGPHDLTVCYRESGWSVPGIANYYGLDAAGNLITTPSETNSPFVEVPMLKSPLTYGYLWFSHINIDGNWVELPTVASRFEKPDLKTAFQIQLVIQSYSSLTPEMQAQARQLFLQVRDQLGAQLVEKLKSGK